MTAVTIVVGNPKPQSRTLHVAETLVDTLLEPATYDRTVVDLALYADDVFRWPSEQMDSLCRSVAQSDLAVIASPTYKAAYTGLLKAFFDRYPPNGLRGLVTIPLMTGESRDHSMAPVTHLTPLLAELGATVLGQTFYFVTSDMERLTEFTEAAADECIETITSVSALTSCLSTSLASRRKS